MNEEEIVQAVAQALQQGMAPEEIVAGLVKDVGIPEDQATQLVQAVMQQMQGGGQGGEQGGAPAEGGQAQGMTAEQAAEALSQLGVAPEIVMQIVDIIMNMSPSEIEKLAAMVAEAPSDEGQAPAEQQSMMGEQPQQYGI